MTRGRRLGGVVVLSLAGVVAAVAAVSANRSHPKPVSLGSVWKAQNLTLSLGETANIPNTDLSGVASMTVYSVTYPVPPDKPSLDPGPGRELAVADVALCRSELPMNAEPTDFTLLLPDAAVIPVLSVHDPAFRFDAKTPGLEDVIPKLAASKCGRGYLTFDIGVGSAPTAFQFRTILPGSTYQWSLPR